MPGLGDGGRKPSLARRGRSAAARELDDGTRRRRERRDAARAGARRVGPRRRVLPRALAARPPGCSARLGRWPGSSATRSRCSASRRLRGRCSTRTATPCVAFQSSFPSGHALRSVLLAAAVAAVWPFARRWVAAWAAASLVLLELSGFHVPSDIAGGLLLALLLVLALPRLGRRSRAGRPERLPSSSSPPFRPSSSCSWPSCSSASSSRPCEPPFMSLSTLRSSASSRCSSVSTPRTRFCSSSVRSRSVFIAPSTLSAPGASLRR